MAQRVYLETSVVSYLTARPSRDIVVAGHQQITHEWWETQRENFHLCISQLVFKEASSGDPQAASRRFDILKTMTLLETTGEALELARELVSEGALPPKAANDALHISIAATNGVPFLLTWNCRHLANAAMRPVIDRVCEQMNFAPPIICTPEELLEATS